MADERIKRKISAILSADVVGYSKRMEADEEATVRIIESYRKTVSSLIEQHNGRVIDSLMNGLLVDKLFETVEVI
jgi:adenylate cyclase